MSMSYETNCKPPQFFSPLGQVSMFTTVGRGEHIDGRDVVMEPTLALQWCNTCPYLMHHPHL